MAQKFNLEVVTERTSTGNVAEAEFLNNYSESCSNLTRIGVVVSRMFNAELLKRERDGREYVALTTDDHNKIIKGLIDAFKE